MLEINEIASMVEEKADRDALLIFGAHVSKEMNDEVSLTIIATGFDPDQQDEPVDPYRPLPPRRRDTQEIKTEDGLSAREVTLDELFDGQNNSGKDDSGFVVPQFLKK